MKRLGRTYLIFILSLGSFTTPARAADAATESALVPLLADAGGAPTTWAALAATESQRGDLREALVAISRNKSYPLPLRLRAVSEYGKFASDSQGELLPDARAFYDSLRSADNGPESDSYTEALMRSLANLNSPEALDWAAARLDASSESVRLAALRTVSDLIETNPYQVTERDGEFAAPAFGVTLSRRKRSGDWKRSVELLERRLRTLESVPAVSSNPTRRDSVAALMRIAAATIEERHASNDSSDAEVSQTTGEAPLVANPSAQHSPEVAETTSSGQRASNAARPIFLIGAGIAAIIFAAWFFMRRKRAP